MRDQRCTHTDRQIWQMWRASPFDAVKGDPKGGRSLLFGISDTSKLNDEVGTVCLCSELFACDRHGCAHMAACATESDGCQNCCPNSCSIRFAVPCWCFHFVALQVMRNEEGYRRSVQFVGHAKSHFSCVLTDDPVSSGCCSCGGLLCVDQGCMCAQVHGVQVERRSGMRDPCFSVQCGSFTQRFLQVWRHLWNLLL